MTTGDVVYSLRFSLIKSAEPEPGFDHRSTAGESSMLTIRLHILYIIVLINHQYACLYVIGITVYLYAVACTVKRIFQEYTLPSYENNDAMHTLHHYCNCTHLL